MPHVSRFPSPFQRIPLLALGLLLAAPCSFAQGSTPARRALVVAVADYPQSLVPTRRSYSRLAGPRNDADSLVVPALRRQGFEVETLVDEEATREGLLAALDRLLDASQPGDLVFIHYSGHGHQVTDASGDEPDGYDEVLVPYGAPLEPEGDYFGEQHVTDDELGAYVADLRRRVYPGGEVLVSFDACHSGSATRGEMPTRTGGAPIGPPGSGAGTRGADDGAAAGALDVSATGTRGSGPGLAPYIFFAAADHDELDHEMYYPNRQPRMTVGPLSYALALSLSQMDEGETYRRLFERIEATFVEAGLNQQAPQAEGDLDTRVFSGQAVVQQPYTPVIDYDPERREVYVEGGLLQGLTEGTRVAFYPAGTDRPEGAPLAEGTITYTSAYDAAVTIDAGDGDPSGAWGFVTRQSLGDVRVPVSIAPGVAEAAAIRDAVLGIGILDLVDAADAPADRVDVQAEDGGLALVQVADGAVLHRLPGGEAGAREAASRLGAYARARYLQRLALRDPDLDLRVEVLPAQFNVVTRGTRVMCSADEAAVARGTAARDASRPANAFHPGEHYALRVTNEGVHETYFTVVSIRPDGEMTQLYPLTGTGDNALAPGASFLLPNCYVASEPAGPDVLKVFATDAPLDLTLLIEGPEVQQTRGARGLLDDLFDDLYLDAESFSEATRSGTLGAPPRLATTSEVVLQVETP